MSPAWSPDGQNLAYVSFEGKRVGHLRAAACDRRAPARLRPARHQRCAGLVAGRSQACADALARRQPRRLRARPGIARTHAPHDRRRDRHRTRVVGATAAAIYFTSDRAGNAQVYRVAVGSGPTCSDSRSRTAITRGRGLSPDGQSLALVTLDRGGYRIATFDLKTRNLHVLTDGRQDESPSFAPNGAVIIYATQAGGRGTLAMVSSDGRFQQRLQFGQGRRARSRSGRRSRRNSGEARGRARYHSHHVRAMSAASTSRSPMKHEIESRDCRGLAGPWPRGLPEAQAGPARNAAGARDDD